jgi:hypothetical protein
LILQRQHHACTSQSVLSVSALDGQPRRHCALGTSVDAEGPDLDGASTIYFRPGPPNLFHEDNKEVRNELIKAAISPSFEAVAHPLPLLFVDATLTTA